MTTDLWLFSLCHPWVVALPVTAVDRVLTIDETPAAVVVTPLASLLGLSATTVGSVVIVRANGTLAALGVDRCLQVGALPPGGFPLPLAALRQGRVVGAFPLSEALGRHDGARFGLTLDPALLVSPS